MYKNNNHESSAPLLILEPIETDNKEAQRKRLDLSHRVKIGRVTGNKTVCHCSNGLFDSKVLSRHHAELWSDLGKVYLQDVGSSNGTFVNGIRLSDENTPSALIELNPGDRIDFGVDILNDQENEVLFKKVSVMVDILSPDASLNQPEGQTDLFNTLKTDSKGNAAKGKSSSESPQQLNRNKRLQQDLQSIHSDASQMHSSIKDQRSNLNSKPYQEPLLAEQLELLSAENQTLHKRVEALMNQVQILERQKRKSSSSSSPSFFTTFILVVLLACLVYFFYVLGEQDRAYWIRKANKEANKIVANMQSFFSQRH